MADSPKVRVRYAPSPTGYFHIGGARTVLFNWLFARQHKGQFILRIEDTDKERSKPEFEKDIFENIAWLGLSADEDPERGGSFGPYRESERIDIHERYLKKLLDEEKAYYCFCKKEQLEEDRQAMLAQGLAPKYSGRCRNVANSESDPSTKLRASERIAKGEPSVIRFRMPETEVEFTDLIRGRVKFNTRLIGDTVIARNLRSPLFNFASPIDDIEMKITHVIRGEDLLPITPQQIMFLRALGLGDLKYAHMPLLLSSSGKGKMSKRNMETALGEYRRNGYLPEAIINFVALLGWHPKDDQEILTIEELLQKFDLRQAQKAGAVFDTAKLDWINARYIKNLPSEELADCLQEFIPPAWLDSEERIVKVIGILQDRLTKLKDFPGLAKFFFEIPEYSKNLLLWPRSEEGSEEIYKIKNNLEFLKATLESIPEADFSKDHLEARIMPLLGSTSRGEFLWPLRAALSGSETSPGPFEILDVLGKKESLRRIRTAIEKLS